MSIVDIIKEDGLIARKTKDAVAASLISTLYAEIVSVGKNNGNRDTTDKEALAVIKKFLDGVLFTVETLRFSSDDKILVANREKEILSTYIEKFQPKQLTPEQLTDIVTKLIVGLPEKSPKQMGAVMKAMKDSYDGMYQGDHVSRMVKALLSS